MRKPSPISISSPRLSTISLPGARVIAVSSSAAALLLTTCAPPAAGTARASAASAPRPRRARRPVTRSNSTSVAPPAVITASSAACDNGARPRLVCTTTPVALMTGRRLAALTGSAATACSATCSGSISPARASCWAWATTDFTNARPSTRAASARRGSASSTSVRGTRLRGSPMSCPESMAEADGNRTRQRQDLPLSDFEDRAGHQTEYASLTHRPIMAGSMEAMGYRLTQYAHGGGCACKIPPGELEEVVRGLTKAAPRDPVAELLVGLDDGDDAAAVRLEGGMALIATTDFFTPVVDDAYDWGRIAATNALSDVYAMGGRPVVAVNLLGWPRDVLPLELAAETLRGGLDVCGDAGCHLAGGHSVDDPEPKYGLAVTGIADPNRLLRNDAGKPGNPLSLTKPLGIGVLNSRHKATGERFPEAIEMMTTLNAGASEAALEAGVECATDITGFGLLGHLYKMARASGVTAGVRPTAGPPPGGGPRGV